MPSSEDTEAAQTLKLRLAKGEITLEEYERLVAIIEKSYKIPTNETVGKSGNVTEKRKQHRKSERITLSVAIVFSVFLLILFWGCSPEMVRQNPIQILWVFFPFLIVLLSAVAGYLYYGYKATPEKKHRLIATMIGVALIVFPLCFFPLSDISLSTPASLEKITHVIIKVEYGDQWQGAYGDQWGIVSWSGTGPRTVTLNRPSDASVWIISANAQKMDGSSNTLRIMITKTDGTILKQGSTSSAYGIAQISHTVQD